MLRLPSKIVSKLLFTHKQFCFNQLRDIICDPFWENLPKVIFKKKIFFVSTVSMMYEEGVIEVSLCVV